jgi:hypothetical protein
MPCPFSDPEYPSFLPSPSLCLRKRRVKFGRWVPAWAHTSIATIQPWHPSAGWTTINHVPVYTHIFFHYPCTLTVLSVYFLSTELPSIYVIICTYCSDILTTFEPLWNTYHLQLIHLLLLEYFWQPLQVRGRCQYQIFAVRSLHMIYTNNIQSREGETGEMILDPDHDPVPQASWHNLSCIISMYRAHASVLGVRMVGNFLE